MIRCLPFFLALAALAEPSLPQRKRFAEQHAAKVVVDWNHPDTCVRVTAPAALRCGVPAWVCPRSFGSAVCSGSFSESRGVTFSLHEPGAAERDAEPLPELVLESESGDDCPECECSGAMGFAVVGAVSAADKARAQRELEQRQRVEQEKCVREAAARQKAERVRRKCTLLLVDPCRQEAFIRCTGKNGDVEAGDPPLGKTLWFSFAPQPDGGAPLGGEWEARDE